TPPPPQSTLFPYTTLFRSKGVKKNWDQMVNNDSQNCPFRRSKRIPDLADALANQEPGEKRRASEAKEPYRHMYLAGCFHRLFESNSSRPGKMGLSLRKTPKFA